ncbi:ribokinase-like isoform X2 [Zootermopsis nevadensis]|uniref:ribokinase-like isoform X2 n=1 Tax=Zootermopsis nevadensis TaxID=136037 RepID=UPI000B8E241C|nr:ribokinase-like isoform X2 [Zootermopsis nevadensis]
MNSKIVVIGSCNIDLQCFTSRLPRPGETLHGSLFRKGFGGKGANQCVAAAKLGASTAMLGDDSFGQDFLEALKSNKINTDFVHITNGISSGMAQITVSDNGENTIVIVAGANNKLSVSDIQQASEIIKIASVVVVQFETPIETTIEALKITKKGKGIAITNAAPATANPDPLVFNLSDMFCVNESEGAGDMFVGSLAFYLACYPELPMKEIVKRSCEMATVSVQKHGTQTSFPTKDDLPAELFMKCSSFK